MPDLADDPRVLRLLEAVLDSGQTPDEVCASCPELIPYVRQQWERCRQIEAELGALFPSSDGSGSGPSRENPELPKLPGHRVESVLGRGGMGVVYRARHLRLDRPVAVKMLVAGPYASRVAVARFLREARAVAGLRHPHIVEIFDCGEHDGLPFYTMELVEGGNLANRLAGVPQPAAEAAALTATLADAVESAHRGGVIHRDLKPSNILLAMDGTPKVSDFGLARAVDGSGDDALTLSGARVGTPNYMAPEQAGGRAGTVGPTADVYALGAILYEALTGRPPFVGESPADTERQVLSVDPVPPSRLNNRVPRDLETICLACLRKDPGRRYPSAAALAADLRRFGRGEPIAARRTGVFERTVKWVRRRPGRSAALAGGGAAAALAFAAAMWWASQRAAIDREVAQDLADASAAQRRSSWTEASADLDRADIRLAGGGPADLRRRLAAGRRDAATVARLDAIALADAGTVGGKFEFAEVDRRYAEAFQGDGLGPVGEGDPGAFGARVAASPIRAALVSALDRWMLRVYDVDRQRWLLAVARAADTDPAGWRGRARDQLADHSDRAALEAVAAAAPMEREPPSTLLLFAQLLKREGNDTVPFLMRAQRAHPDDFWINETLADHLGDRHRAREATYYGQIGVALRPNVAMAYNNLGSLLQFDDRLGAACDAYARAVRLDPTSPVCQTNFGFALFLEARYAESLEPLSRAVALRPGDAEANSKLADTLIHLGRDAEAVDGLRRAVASGSAPASAWQHLRAALARLGRWDEAAATWPTARQLSPVDQDLWSGEAEFHLFRGEPDAYRAAARAQLDQFEAATDPRVCERVGRACLLLPDVAPDLLQRATATIDRALVIDRDRKTWVQYDRTAKALAEYRAGRPSAALALLATAPVNPAWPLPQLVTAMALARAGNDSAAEEALLKAEIQYDWGLLQSTTVNMDDAWMFDVVRREAEATVMPGMTEVLAGHRPPRDVGERVALFAASRASGDDAVAARVWAEVFGRLNVAAAGLALGEPAAARAAAVAGRGGGRGGAALSPGERATFRDHARTWLGALLASRLAAWEKLDAGGHLGVRRELRSWQADTELAAIRDTAALQSMPNDEREKCRSLWAGVAALAERPTGED